MLPLTDPTFAANRKHDDEKRAREARRPTVEQRRAERVRLLRLGRAELCRRWMRFDDRTWNELLPFSAEFFVDSLINRWEKDGWLKAPSGQAVFRPDIAAIRAALPVDAIEARSALDAIADMFAGGPSSTSSSA